MSTPSDVCVLESVDEREADELCDLSFHRPPMKHSDTRGSISSVDSDISLSFDADGRPSSRRPSDEGARLADMSDCGSDAGSVGAGSGEAGGGKDSGCEVADQEPPFVPPDDETADRIVAQVEFYFSDVNITKDAFLLKHVKRNKEGYVSLKLISSFKRVKHLVKDWRVVAYSLARSTLLQINEAGTKLRRTTPLPEYDQTTPSRTVVALDLPSDKPTIESVAELFSTYGEIALIRILRPGNPVPADVRNFFAKRPELNGAVCALVEYVRTESARRALQLQGRDWRGFSQGIRVIELNTPASGDRRKKSVPSKKTSISKLVDSEYSSYSSYSSSCASGSETEDRLRGDPRARYRRGSSPSSSSLSSSFGSFNRSSSDLSPWLQRRMSHRDSGSDGNSSSSSSRRNSGNNAYPDDARRTSSGSFTCDRRVSGSSINGDRRVSGSSISGERRISGSSINGERRISGSQASCDRRMSGSLLPENVLRLPFGPDGTTGFQGGLRERLKTMNLT